MERSVNCLAKLDRMTKTLGHREADRVPIIDSPWGATIERWHREGMPEGMSFVDYFGLDHVAGISVDNSPRYEWKVLEETAEYRVYTTRWGPPSGTGSTPPPPPSSSTSPSWTPRVGPRPRNE
jgi:hypothetical protein